MGPKKNKRNKEKDEEFDSRAESKLQELLKNMEKSKEEEQPDASDLYVKKDKQIFNFDFSNERAIYNQKQPERKVEPVIQLTPEEIQIIKKRQEKQKIQRVIKEKIKSQRKQERKKVLEQQKQQERLIKEEQEKEDEEVDKKIKSAKKQGDAKYIVLIFVVCLVILFLLQFQKEMYAKLSKFRISDQVNFYQVLQTDSGVTNQELKAKYKKLVLKYHPDKNTNCKTCKQKFNEIMKAWQILGNPEKRKHYDENSGYISQIKSDSITLTPNNYQDLIQSSNSLWMIEVYDSTNEYCHFFSQFWEEAIHLNKGFVNFGRIDVWHQTNMLSYIPYRFAVFPGLYTYQQGQIKMCDLNYNQPMASISACIDSNYRDNLFKKINSLEEIEDYPNKKSIVFGGNVKIGSKIKIIHKKYQKYFNFYKMDDNENVIKVKETNEIYKFGQNAKTLYQKYDNFLQSLIVQQKSICSINFLCENNPCIILIQKDLPLPKQHKYQVLSILQQQQFGKKIEAVKNSSGMMEKFDLGLYQNGRIELGYADEIDSLNADNGELLDLTCFKQSFFQKVKETLWE